MGSDRVDNLSLVVDRHKTRHVLDTVSYI